MKESNLSTGLQRAENVIALWRAKERPIVVAIDGRSGSGKTQFTQTLAEEIAAAGNPALASPTTSIVGLDLIYPGWSGIEAAVEILSAQVIPSWLQSQHTEHFVYDWSTMAYGSTREVPLSDILLLEGCGSGARRLAPQVDLLIWLEAPIEIRRCRALYRDGDTFRPWWEHWASQEDLHYRTNGTSARADIIVDTTT